VTSCGTIPVFRSATPADTWLPFHGGGGSGRLLSSLCVAGNPTLLSQQLTPIICFSIPIRPASTASTIESCIDSDINSISPRSPMNSLSDSPWESQEPSPIDSRLPSTRRRSKGQSAIAEEESITSMNRADQSPIFPTQGKEETLLSKELSQLDEVRKGLDRRSSGRRKIKPNLQPSFTFAGYVNESPILQELIQLGVNLTKWEKGRIPDEVIQLEPERDLRPIVRHLRRLGVTKNEDVGQILTQNPFILIYGPTIFKEKTDYFVRKKFSAEQLAVVMKGAPQLFSRSVEAIDARLGFFQSTFALTGDQVRETVVEHPQLFQMKLSLVKQVNFHMSKFLEFKPNEIRELFITVPSIFTMNPQNLQNRFDQLHVKMMIPHQTLVKFPYLLKVPKIVVSQRHKFLATIGKADYDPLSDSYTSLTAFTDFDDERFAQEVAGLDYQTYKNFLKTL